MNAIHNNLFSVYAAYNKNEGCPGPDDDSSSDAASDHQVSDCESSSGEPAPPYPPQNVTPTPFKSDYSFLRENQRQNLSVRWAQDTRYGAAPIPSGSAAASSHAAPSEAPLGPLTSSGEYYSLSILFKETEVRKFYTCSCSITH